MAARCLASKGTHRARRCWWEEETRARLPQSMPGTTVPCSPVEGLGREGTSHKHSPAPSQMTPLLPRLRQVTGPSGQEASPTPAQASRARLALWFYGDRMTECETQSHQRGYAPQRGHTLRALPSETTMDTSLPRAGEPYTQ